MLDADGRCLYFIAIERDVTQRRVIERYESNRAGVLEMALCNERLDKQLGRTVLMLKDVIPGSFGTIVLLERGRLTTGAADPALSLALLAATDGCPIGPRGLRAARRYSSARPSSVKTSPSTTGGPTAATLHSRPAFGRAGRCRCSVRTARSSARLRFTSSGQVRRLFPSCNSSSRSLA